MSSAGEGLSRPLPEQVRSHVVELASQILGSMAAAVVPPPLKGIARFDPRKRAKLGGAPIAAQLESDKKFRELVAEALATGWPELVASLADGVVPPAACPRFLESPRSQCNGQAGNPAASNPGSGRSHRSVQLGARL